MVNTQGAFIAIEGAEGSGKSSVISYLQEQFPEIVFTREPGGTPYAEHIREVMVHSEHTHEGDPLTFMLLVFASRRVHILRRIIPALAQGKTVVTDRFAASSWAHNLRNMESVDAEKLFYELHKHVVGEVIPHYIFLDIDPILGLERKKQQRTQNDGRTDHFEQQTVDFHVRSYLGYKEFLTQTPHTIIDATQPLQAVCLDVQKTIKSLL